MSDLARAAGLSRLEYLVWTVTRGIGFVALTIALLLGVALLSQPVIANPTDAQRNDLVQLLANRYAEAPVGRGLTDKGALIEVFSTNDGATWTIILTLPSGKSRVLDAGQAWTPVTSVRSPGI